MIHAPNEDDRKRDPTREELAGALAAAKQVCKDLKAGKRVLVTCQAGLNRSGLVSAISLHLLYGWEGSQCVRQVQLRRPDALFNLGFVHAILRLQAKDPAWTHQLKLV